MLRSFHRAVFGMQKALLLLLTATPAVADVGAISVEVIDAVTRRPVDGVAITAESRDGEVRSATTDRGRVLLDSLEDGFFEVRAESAGYVTAVEPAVRVLEQRTGRLRFELQPVVPDWVEEIVVIARAREADPFGGVSDTFLSRDELRNAAGSGSDVMRALSGLPGVVSNGEFAAFSVRGHGPKSNLIYVDGFPFQQVAHFEQTLGDESEILNGGRYSIFAPNAVAGAEFSPGGWSAEFGGRDGSLLQLEVVDGAPSPVGSVRLDFAGAEFLYQGPSGFHDNTTVFLEARRFDFSQLFEIIEEESLGAPISTDVILKTHTRIDDDDEFEFLAIYAPEENTLDITHILAAEEEDGIEDVTLQNDDQDLALIGGTWRRRFGNDGEWINRIFYRESDRLSSQGEAFPDLVPPGTPADQVPVRENLLTIRENESEFGWRSDVSFGNGLGVLRAGLQLTSNDLDYSTVLREDWIRYIYESDDPRPAGANYIVLQPDAINSIYSASETNYAVYGEQIFDWGNSNLRAGVRYERNGFGDEDLVSPRFGFNQTISPRLRLSATAGIFYEPPSNLERAADPDNFDLESEELTHISLGFDYRLSDNLNLLVEAYYQDLDNRLVESGRTNGRISNDGEGTNTGVDLVLRRRFDQGWSADFIYSWNRFRVDDNDGRGEFDWDFNREHFVAVGGRWEINDRWQIAARWRYGSGQPTYRYIVHEDVLAPNPPRRYSQERFDLNSDRGDAFHSLDVRVDYRRPVGPVDLVLFADVLNVYGGPAGLRPEFNILSGEIVDEEEETLPLLGLIVEYAW